MSIKTVDAKQLKAWLESGEAVVVDVRDANEFNEWRIPQAVFIPLPTLETNMTILDNETRKIVFLCQTGPRGELAAKAAINKFGVQRDVYNLQGGLKAWDEAGFTMIRNQSNGGSTMPIMRQVQVTAGSIVLVFSLLALLGVKFGAFVTLLIGCGLTFAGLSGWCGMAMVLQKMPWNQKKS